MISRIWHGWTTPENAGVYEALLLDEVLPAIADMEIPGYHGAHVLRRSLDGEMEFVTVLWFESLDSIRAFVGEDYEIAHVPREAREVLTRFDARSQHYEMVLAPSA
jgi:heme-degrading monooxygenase HmoA